MNFVSKFLFKIFGSGKLLEFLTEILGVSGRKDYINELLPKVEGYVKLADGLLDASGSQKHNFVVTEIEKFLKSVNKPFLTSVVNLVIEIAVNKIRK